MGYHAATTLLPVSPVPLAVVPSYLVRTFRLVHPLLRRLSPGFVHALAYLCSVPIHLALRLPLPWSPYRAQLRRFPFAHLHKIVFDQLLPTCFYYTSPSPLDRTRSRLPSFP